MKNKTIYIIIGVAIVIILIFSMWSTSDRQIPVTAAPYLYKDLIRIDAPVQEQTVSISGPIKVSGSARGNWYFEASFPIQVLDSDGTILAQSFVQAQGDWMTADFVPFMGEVSFTKPTGKTGSVVFRKDNPSGLPEHDDFVSIPINFE